MAALYLGDADQRIRVVTKEGDQPVEQADWRSTYTLC